MSLTSLLLNSTLPIRELTKEESLGLKKILLEMYKDISYVCDKEGLIVMLGGGSCLGAVRHKGFIPWDDDLDLNMLRADYDKFPEALEKHFPRKYILRGPGVSDDFILPFFKIEKRGTVLKTIYELKNEEPAIGIDLFPIENVPNGKISRLFFGIMNNFYQYVSVCVKLYSRKDCPVTQLLYSTKEGKKTIGWRLFVGRCFSFKDYRYWFSKSDAFAQKYKNKSTLYLTCPTGRKHFFGELLKKSDVEPVFDCSFEGLPAKIYGNYDKYLSSLYGDYMQIPPVEKREKHFIVDISFG